MQFCTKLLRCCVHENLATGVLNKRGFLRQNDNMVLNNNPHHMQVLCPLLKALWDSLLSSLGLFEAISYIRWGRPLHASLRGFRVSAERRSVRCCLCRSRSLKKRRQEEQKQGCLSLFRHLEWTSADVETKMFFPFTFRCFKEPIPPVVLSGPPRERPALSERPTAPAYITWKTSKKTACF